MLRKTGKNILSIGAGVLLTTSSISQNIEEIAKTMFDPTVITLSQTKLTHQPAEGEYIAYNEHDLLNTEKIDSIRTHNQNPYTNEEITRRFIKHWAIINYDFEDNDNTLVEEESINKIKLNEYLAKLDTSRFKTSAIKFSEIDKLIQMEYQANHNDKLNLNLIAYTIAKDHIVKYTITDKPLLKYNGKLSSNDELDIHKKENEITRTKNGFKILNDYYTVEVIHTGEQAEIEETMPFYLEGIVSFVSELAKEYLTKDEISIPDTILAPEKLVLNSDFKTHKAFKNYNIALGEDTTIVEKNLLKFQIYGKMGNHMLMQNMSLNLK